MILEAIHDQIVKMQVTRVRRRRKSLLRRQIGKLLKLLLLQQCSAAQVFGFEFFICPV
jgi:hypothetical protein